eukprot:Skav223006  [mRNA]  locus=scaffold1422:8433:10090:+ [translate_table: standard]
MQRQTTQIRLILFLRPAVGGEAAWGQMSSFNGCDGSKSQIGKWLWDEVKLLISVDMAGREDGRSLDPRSDNLESLRQVMNREVLPDLDSAVKDCVLGVMSLIFLTLPAVDLQERVKRSIG